MLKSALEKNSIFRKVVNCFPDPINTLRKSSVILRLYFGNLPKLLSANTDGTLS